LYLGGQELSTRNFWAISKNVPIRNNKD
jgi:hypothetical protein